MNDTTIADIKSMSLEELEIYFVQELGLKKFRALQVYQWLWQRGVKSFEEMSNIAKPVRASLNQVAEISFLDIDTKLESIDGTVKYLWRLSDDYVVESVLIPDGDRLTLCVSTQVGCAMKCSFCLTGDMGLKRQLQASEIANQVLQVSQELPDRVRITNIVMMGMGEPLHNFDNLIRALGIMLHDRGLNLSHRKITVSTVGLAPKILELGRLSPVNLAISLNATTEEQRKEIMPITNKYSLEEVMAAARAFPLPSGKRITFEYVMLGGFNDTLEDAARLYRLLRGVKAKLNLIPYNENPNRDIKRPSQATVRAFQNYFVSRGMNCTVRTTRGVDISAACGQLGKSQPTTVSKQPPTDQAG